MLHLCQSVCRPFYTKYQRWNACLPVQAISDMRGMEKLLGISSTPAEYGCFECWKRGVTITKMCYCQHQAFLPLGHPLRRILSGLNNPKKERRDLNSIMVPTPRTQEQVKQGKVHQPAAHDNCMCIPTTIYK